MAQTLEFFIAKDGKTETYQADIKLFYNKTEVQTLSIIHYKAPHEKNTASEVNKKSNDIIIPFDMICQVKTDQDGNKNNFRLNATYNYKNGEKTERHNLRPLQ